MSDYRGGCHCGAFQMTYRTALEPARWPLRACGCSFCRCHGSVATSDPAGSVSFEIADPSLLSHYRFGHKTAEFLICSNCGVFLAAVIDTPSGARAVINVNTLTGVPLDLGSATTTNFDSEPPEQRTERRSRNWTPVLR